MMQNTTREKIKNWYVNIHKLFQIEQSPEMNPLAVKWNKMLYKSTRYHL